MPAKQRSGTEGRKTQAPKGLTTAQTLLFKTVQQMRRDWSEDQAITFCRENNWDTTEVSDQLGRIFEDALPEEEWQEIPVTRKPKKLEPERTERSERKGRKGTDREQQPVVTRPRPPVRTEMNGSHSKTSERVEPAITPSHLRVPVAGKSYASTLIPKKEEVSKASAPEPAVVTGDAAGSSASSAADAADPAASAVAAHTELEPESQVPSKGRRGKANTEKEGEKDSQSHQTKKWVKKGKESQSAAPPAAAAPVSEEVAEVEERSQEVAGEENLDTTSMPQPGPVGSPDLTHLISPTPPPTPAAGHTQPPQNKKKMGSLLLNPVVIQTTRPKLVSELLFSDNGVILPEPANKSEKVVHFGNFGLGAKAAATSGAAAAAPSSQQGEGSGSGSKKGKTRLPKQPLRRTRKSEAPVATSDATSAPPVEGKSDNAVDAEVARETQGEHAASSVASAAASSTSAEDVDGGAGNGSGHHHHVAEEHQQHEESQPVLASQEVESHQSHRRQPAATAAASVSDASQAQEDREEIVEVEGTIGNVHTDHASSSGAHASSVPAVSSPALPPTSESIGSDSASASNAVDSESHNANHAVSTGSEGANALGGVSGSVSGTGAHTHTDHRLAHGHDGTSHSVQHQQPQQQHRHLSHAQTQTQTQAPFGGQGRDDVAYAMGMGLNQPQQTAPQQHPHHQLLPHGAHLSPAVSVSVGDSPQFPATPAPSPAIVAQDPYSVGYYGQMLPHQPHQGQLTGAVAGAPQTGPGSAGAGGLTHSHGSHVHGHAHQQHAHAQQQPSGQQQMAMQMQQPMGVPVQMQVPQHFAPQYRHAPAQVPAGYYDYSGNAIQGRPQTRRAVPPQGMPQGAQKKPPTSSTSGTGAPSELPKKYPRGVGVGVGVGPEGMQVMGGVDAHPEVRRQRQAVPGVTRQQPTQPQALGTRYMDPSQQQHQQQQQQYYPQQQYQAMQQTMQPQPTFKLKPAPQPQMAQVLPQGQPIYYSSPVNAPYAGPQMVPGPGPYKPQPGTTTAPAHFKPRPSHQQPQPQNQQTHSHRQGVSHTQQQHVQQQQHAQQQHTQQFPAQQHAQHVAEVYPGGYYQYQAAPQQAGGYYPPQYSPSYRGGQYPTYQTAGPQVAVAAPYQYNYPQEGVDYEEEEFYDGSADGAGEEDYQHEWSGAPGPHMTHVAHGPALGHAMGHGHYAHTHGHPEEGHNSEDEDDNPRTSQQQHPLPHPQSQEALRYMHQPYLL